MKFVQLCEYTTELSTLKRVNYMVYELYLKNNNNEGKSGHKMQKKYLPKMK